MLAALARVSRPAIRSSRSPGFPSRVSRSSSGSVALNTASTNLDFAASAARAARAPSAFARASSFRIALSARGARFSGVALALLSRKDAPAPRAA
jgi:hypothetical protein